MENQLIISLGREFGSGGHVIAEKIAEQLNLPLYDWNLLQDIASEKNLDAKKLEKYDEKPIIPFMSRTIRGYTNSLEENIAQMQFNYLKEKAAAGESFVVVGRCAESILKDNQNMISLFILGDMDKKVERIMHIHQVSGEKAKEIIKDQDKKRKMYHNYYCKGKWGDSRNYELSINSSKLGIDRTTEILLDYINKRIAR